MFFSLSNRMPKAISMTPPVAVSASIWAIENRSPSRNAARVRLPCRIPTATAENSTPQPSVLANAIAAKPSSTDLTSNWSAPRPRPSDSEPRIVSGPMQTSSGGVTIAATKGPASPVAAKRWLSRAAPHSRRCSIRSAEPATVPNSSEPSTISMGAPAPTASVRFSDDIVRAEPTPRTSVIRPSTSVIVMLVRSGIRSPRSRPMTAPTATVTTLVTVPIPMNMGPIESPSWNSA